MEPDLSGIATVLLWAGAVGAATYQAVKLLRSAFDPHSKAKSWVWIASSFVLGVAVVFFIDFDVSAVPSNAPDSVVRVVLGLFAGASTAAFHRAEQASKAKTEHRVSEAKKT